MLLSAFTLGKNLVRDVFFPLHIEILVLFRISRIINLVNLHFTQHFQVRVVRLC